MSDKSSIEWTQGDDGTPGATWNPVTGCTKVSPGCDHCYAETFAERWRGTPGHHFENGFDVTLRRERLEQPLHWKRPRRIFVNSMSDLFHESVPDAYIASVFVVMAKAPQHTFQVLTKRHGRMRSLLNSPGFHVFAAAAAASRGWDLEDVSWPLPNVWLGVSVEDQKWADIRIPALLGTPAAVRFLSCEPLLGPVDLSRWMPAGVARWHCGGCGTFYGGEWRQVCPRCNRTGYWSGSHVGNGHPAGQPLSWVISGGESGPKARPMHPAWARSLRDQCDAADVPFFFKQWGEWGPQNAVTWPLSDAWRTPQRHRWVSPDDGRTKPFGEFTGTDDLNWAHMKRIGKKAAGRELDGQVCDEFPRAAEAVTA